MLTQTGNELQTMIKTNTHRGEVIRDAIKASGVAIGVVAEKMGISRKTLYNKFKEDRKSVV